MKKPTSAKTNATVDAPKLIDAAIKDLGDWRGETLAKIRKLIKEADPDVVEEWKWGIPVWSHDGIICTGETYKAYVKTTFAKGASVSDPAKLFNSSLEGATRRAIEREALVLPRRALTETRQPLHVAPDGPRIRLGRGRDVVGLARDLLRQIESLGHGVEDRLA